MRDSILATLIYYDVLDFPLTLFEIKKYLINPARFTILPQPVREMSIGDIQKELNSLISGNRISQKNGFYFLKERGVLYEKRMEKNKIAEVKWRKLLKISKWFVLIPYLRGILVGGSMAYNNITKDSDFDILVIAKFGRLYTCRIFLSLIASFFGARRKRFDLIAPDKFCFNHYLTDGSLNIEYESLYNAQSYANLKPVLIKEALFKKFYGENIWLNKYVYNFRLAESFVLRKIKPSLVLAAFSKIAEKILDSFLGDWLEGIFKHFQQKRIKNNPATYESGGRVVFNDSELEFHPRSFEKILLAKYNEGLKKMGIFAGEEKDSGLK